MRQHFLGLIAASYLKKKSFLMEIILKTNQTEYFSLKPIQSQLMTRWTKNILTRVMILLHRCVLCLFRYILVYFYLLLKKKTTHVIWWYCNGKLFPTVQLPRFTPHLLVIATRHNRDIDNCSIHISTDDGKHTAITPHII